MSQKRMVICFVSMLIFGLLFSVSLVGGSIERNSNPEKLVPPPEVGHKLLPENEMPPAFITWGKLPKFENKEAEREWLEELSKLGKRLHGDDVPFWYPDGPVVAHGVGGDGYYHVGIRGDLVGNVDNIMITKIVTTINDVARKEVGFEREVPIKFEPWGETVLCDARDDEWRPVIGGIQVQQEDQGLV